MAMSAAIKLFKDYCFSCDGPCMARDLHCACNMILFVAAWQVLLAASKDDTAFHASCSCVGGEWAVR